MPPQEDKDKWKNFLNPYILKPSLIIYSIFITVFEILKQQVVERIKYFYVEGFVGDKLIINEKYNKEVLSRHKNALYASLDWHLEKGIISKEDIELFHELRKQRNKLAHEMTTVIFEGNNDSIIVNLEKMINLLKKIELWWIVNVEIPTDPDINIDDVDIDQIIPGNIMMIELLLEIALNEGEEPKKYYDIYLSMAHGRGSSG
jgi:hypothetical protein